MALLRFVGLILLLTIFIASGYFKIVAPKDQAAYLSKSNFPLIFNEVTKLAGVSYKLAPQDYVLIIQAAGGIFVSLSAFIILGVGRSFFAFLLALGTAFITVCFHLNITNPALTSKDDQVHVLKNLAIIGGLLYVAGGAVIRRVPVPVAADSNKTAKKKQ